MNDDTVLTITYSVTKLRTPDLGVLVVRETQRPIYRTVVDVAFAQSRYIGTWLDDSCNGLPPLNWTRVAE